MGEAPMLCMASGHGPAKPTLPRSRPSSNPPPVTIVSVIRAAPLPATFSRPIPACRDRGSERARSITVAVLNGAPPSLSRF